MILGNLLDFKVLSIHQLMHQWVVLKNNIKIYIKMYIKTAPTCFGATVTSSGSALIRLRPGLNPRNWVLKASTLPLDHWSRYIKHILIYLLTYLLSPWCTVLLEKLTGLQLVKKFPAFLRNPKVPHRTHKRPPPVPILGQPNPVHIPTSHLLETHPNINHPSMLRSPQWSLSLRFPHQDPIHPPILH